MAEMNPIPEVPGDDSIVPLFQTRTSVLRTIRMETVQDRQTVALINQAITDVRLEFYTEVGKDRVDVIVGYPDEENPTTTEGIVKAQARTAEVYWIIYKLLPMLPSVFMDNSASVNEAFNEEPLTRDATFLQKYAEYLKATFTKLVNAIKEPAETGDGVSSSALIERQDEDGEADPYIVADNFIGLSQGTL